MSAPVFQRPLRLHVSREARGAIIILVAGLIVFVGIVTMQTYQVRFTWAGGTFELSPPQPAMLAPK